MESSKDGRMRGPFGYRGAKIEGVKVSRVLKNVFNTLLIRATEGPAKIMHSLMFLISGAQRKSHFSQATLEKSMEGLFQQPVGDVGVQPQCRRIGESPCSPVVCRRPIQPGAGII
jgi:hypothetical protein